MQRQPQPWVRQTATALRRRWPEAQPAPSRCPSGTQGEEAATAHRGDERGGRCGAAACESYALTRCITGTTTASDDECLDIRSAHEQLLPSRPPSLSSLDFFRACRRRNLAHTFARLVSALWFRLRAVCAAVFLVPAVVPVRSLSSFRAASLCRRATVHKSALRSRTAEQHTPHSDASEKQRRRAYRHHA